MIKSIADQYLKLTNREKFILTMTVLIIIWSGWDKFIHQPLMIKQSALGDTLSDITIQLTAQQQAGKQLKKQGAADPNQANRTKLNLINKQLAQLKQQLDNGGKKFVPAQLMPTVLHDMLKQAPGIKLVKLETIPTALFAETVQQPWIYKHGLSITINGNYFDTLRYLQALESLPWRLNWDSIDYQVSRYPIAETTLVVYTLSFEENWLDL